MNDPKLIICLDCGVPKPLHKEPCCARITESELIKAGFTLKQPYGAYNGCIPQEVWARGDKQYIKFLSTCGDKDCTYLYTMDYKLVTREILK